MRKFSSLPRVKPHGVQKEVETAENRKGRRLSFVEEMQNNFETDSSFDLGTPNSQSMTDTDPPSKSFTLVRSSKPRLQANTMKAISEDGELDDSGADEDLKHWSEYQNRRESTDGLLNEITEMKSEVRHEIEVMGSKMNHLEENISAILSLLKERDTPTSVPGDGYRSRNGLPPNLNVPRTAPGSARSRTASIISRVKAEIPEETLPPWIEKEHLEMTEDISTSEDVMTTPEKHDTPEKPRKTRSQKSKRKKREKSENETKQTTENISHQHDLKEEKEHSAPTAEETSGKISSLSQHETQEENLPLTSMNEATNEELLLQVGNETEVADEPVTSAIKETSEKISWQSQQESDDDGEVVASNSEAAGGKVSRANACDIQHFDEQEGLGSEETEMKQLTV